MLPLKEKRYKNSNLRVGTQECPCHCYCSTRLEILQDPETELKGDWGVPEGNESVIFALMSLV